MQDEAKPVAEPNTQDTEGKPARELTVGKVLLFTSLQAITFALIGLALWWFSDRPVSQFITFDLEQLLYGVGLAAILSALAFALFFGIPKVGEYLVRAQADNFSFLEKKLSFGGIVIISLCAGVGEEALFRAGIQTLMGDYTGAPIAIFVTSVLFALIHWSKPLVSLILFVIGAAFGWIFWVTGSLLIVMVGHTLYDVFALWYLQKEMHRLDIFGKGADKTKPSKP